jgi:hypothetical protein
VLSTQSTPAPADRFETTDFYLASYLRCAGYALLGLRREGTRAVFIFTDRPERRSTVMAFYANQGSVPPLAFVGAIRNLKALIHNA